MRGERGENYERRGERREKSFYFYFNNHNDCNNEILNIRFY